MEQGCSMIYPIGSSEAPNPWYQYFWNNVDASCTMRDSGSKDSGGDRDLHQHEIRDFSVLFQVPLAEKLRSACLELMIRWYSQHLQHSSFAEGIL